MELYDILLIVFTVTEVALLAVLVMFFMRLKKSEALVSQLQSKQEELLTKLHFNAQLEQELIQSFEKRQQVLGRLDELLADKSTELKKLLAEAEKATKSPHLLRQIVLRGHSQGRSADDLAKATGLARDEVELIIDQETR